VHIYELYNGPNVSMKIQLNVSLMLLIADLVSFSLLDNLFLVADVAIPLMLIGSVVYKEYV